jgi:hypothetical protein
MSPETPVEPWGNVSADFIAALPEAQGFDVLLVVVDPTKKQMHTILTAAKTSGLGLAKLYHDNIMACQIPLFQIGDHSFQQH